MHLGREAPRAAVFPRIRCAAVFPRIFLHDTPEPLAASTLRVSPVSTVRCRTFRLGPGARGCYNEGVFERSIREARLRFERAGLLHVFAGVRRFSVVREESYHDESADAIGLNPADVRRPFAAFHRRPFLVIHELAHHFANQCLTRKDKMLLEPLFGDLDRTYRRAPKPRRCGPDYVSRYAMTHPLEDFAETFAVRMWREIDRRAVEDLLRKRSGKCARKFAAVDRLIRREARRHARRGERGPPPTPNGSPPAQA